MTTRISHALGVPERVASTNISFLVGSGASKPLLATLGTIETLLNSSEEGNTAEDDVARRFLQHSFFRSSIEPAVDLLDARQWNVDPTAAGYVRFYRALQALLHRRDSATDGRRATIFTTNYDPLSELALEAVGMDYADGFNGRIRPTFSMGNFGSLRYLRSSHFETTTEAPVVDVHKLHGSVTWQLNDAQTIEFDGQLQRVVAAKNASDAAPVYKLKIEGRAYESIKRSAVRIHNRCDLSAFGDAYDRLAIVNPTTAKYASTVLTRAYYDQMRALSNELERTNSTVFSVGFSFEDLHIREIVLRALDSNPTLCLIAFGFDELAEQRLTDLLRPAMRRNSNVIVQGPLEVNDPAGTRTINWSLTEVTKRVLEPAIPRSLRNKGRR